MNPTICHILSENFAEDRTDIPLRGGDILFKYNRVGEYDLSKKSVVKHGRFLNVSTGNEIAEEGKPNHFDPYERYACSFDQLTEWLSHIGDVSMEVRKDIWVVLTPHELRKDF